MGTLSKIRKTKSASFPVMGKKAFPLRKVVARNVVGVEKYIDVYDKACEYNYKHYVRLECGHEVPPSRDFFGETGSLSQRCGKCFASTSTDYSNYKTK